GVAAHGCQHHPHRPVAGDRPDARGPRGRSGDDADRRRPPGRPGGGRAPGRLPQPRRGRRRTRRQGLTRGPMSVAILREGDLLIASIESDLSDSEVVTLRDDLTRMVGDHRVRGIIIDVAALDVIDSFVARALRAIVLTARLRGAETVIVGIQPDVAIAMVQFRLNLEPLRAALDLDAAKAIILRRTQGDAP